MTTANLTGSSNAGGLESSHTTYANARAGTVVGTNGQNDSRAGQRFSSPTYYVWESFIEFDCSSIPSGSDVSAVTLELRAQSWSDLGTNCTLQAYVVDYGAGLTTADWRDLTTFSGTLLASKATTGWSVSAYNAFTESGTDFQSAVAAAAGSTLRLMIISDRALAGNTPTGNEYPTFFSYDATYPPKLGVEYTESSTPITLAWLPGRYGR